MSRARRRSRAPGGRTERRSRRGHHPAHGAGKVRADAPRATRQTGYGPTQETTFALPPSGEYGGAGGVEGRRPLSPHAPRRAGDPPPMPGSSRNAGKNKTNGRAGKPPLTPCPTPGRRPAAHAGQQPQDREKGISHRSSRNAISHVRRESLRYGETAAGYATPHMRREI